MPADAPDPADATRFLASKTRESVAGHGAAQVWAEVTALAQSPGVLDLGQGWPDFGASEVARRAAADAIVDSPDPSANQYSVVPGRPELRSAIERYYRSTGTREPGEVLVTTSATEAIYVAIQALCDPGDEIVFLEPFFPWYISHVRAHGGVPVAVPMARSPDADDGGFGFRLDLDALRAAFGPKTKAFLYNSPHNPTGAVFTPEEMAAVASLCAERDVVCVADEVYERCVFGDASVARMADAPGMRERTLTVGTSSKLLCLSGWRVGWIAGPPALVAAIRSLHSYTTYCAPTPLQLGVAAALESIADEADAATRERARDAASRADEERGERARRHAAAKATRGVVAPDDAARRMGANATTLGAALRDAGLLVCPPRGGYFLVADVSPLGLTSVEYCRRLAREAKVAAVPLDVFFDGEGEDFPNVLVRFAVCKRAETIEACAAAIRAHPVRGD